MTLPAGTQRVRLYDTAYSNFRLGARERVRVETYGQDIGQNGWLTTGEWRAALELLELSPGSRVLDVACGSGGPDVYLALTTGAEVVGVDIHSQAIEAARERARRDGLTALVSFEEADAGRPLPFEDASFDAIVCIDALNHLHDRPGVLRDWHRLLRPGGRILFSDPTVVTGPLSSEEIAQRAAIGYFVFSLRDDDERLVREAGFELGRCEDTTESVVRVARRWRDARARHRAELLADEGEETFEGLQRFLSTVHALAAERRLSRYMFLARRPEKQEAGCQAPGDAWERHLGRYSPGLAAEMIGIAGVERGQPALDVGCGRGPLAEALAALLGAGSVAAVDPSEANVTTCKERLPGADVRVGRAEELPFDDGAFDAALAQLVVPWVSDPRRGVAEMRRVVRPGGVVAACSWDFARGMTMLRTFWDAALALDPRGAREAGAAMRIPLCTPDELRELWRRVGLVEIDTGELVVGADYSDFDDFWWPFTAGAGSSGSYCASLDKASQEALRKEVHRRLGSPEGPFRLSARAWYVRGTVPALSATT